MHGPDLISLPSPHVVHEDGELKATFEVNNLYPGYGVTLGSALRRMLLSSLSGAAVTTVKIEGVEHEFTTIPGVLEDVVTILLRIKQLRFRIETDEPQIVRLQVKGEGEVLAKALKVPPAIEVINPDFLLATITKKGVTLTIEMRVERGTGYVPREKLNAEKMEVGAIALDAIFTPIRKVNFEVENMRVGTETNYNKLRMYIETDGTITPREAWHDAIEILEKQFAVLKKEKTAEVEGGEETGDIGELEMAEGMEMEKGGGIPSEEEFLKMHISDLSISSRTIHVLEAANIKTVGGLIRKSPEDLRSLDGIGDKALQEIRRVLGTMGFSLKAD